MIDDVKVLLGLKDDIQDSLLSIYEKQAKQKIMNRLGQYPSRFDYIVADYMVYKFRKRGMEDSSNVKEDVLSKTVLTDEEFFKQYEKEFEVYLKEVNKRKTTLRFLRC
jgi:uncharacterized protein YutD